MLDFPTGKSLLYMIFLHTGLAVIDRLWERLSSRTDANVESTQRHI